MHYDDVDGSTTGPIFLALDATCSIGDTGFASYLATPLEEAEAQVAQVVIDRLYDWREDNWPWAIHAAGQMIDLLLGMLAYEGIKAFSVVLTSTNDAGTESNGVTVTNVNKAVPANAYPCTDILMSDGDGVPVVRPAVELLERRPREAASSRSTSPCTTWTRARRARRSWQPRRAPRFRTTCT